MTPTREQLKSIEWAGADRYGSVCPACGEPARHHPNCWLAACLAAPPQEAAPMPPVEIGDWVNLATEYRTDVMRIRSGYGRVSSDIEADAFNQRGRWHVALADQQPPDITEIRKANGTVWTREPRR